MSKYRLHIGVATIGQAPRPDMMADLRAIIGDEPTVSEAGALDHLEADAVRRLAPDHNEFPLVSRLRDGSVVELSRARVIPLLQAAVDRLAEAGAKIFVILCTGEFPKFRAPGPVLLPQVVLAKTVDALAVHRVGVLPPLPGQVSEVTARWREMGYDPVVEAASPYGADAAVVEAADRLRQAGVELAILDCQAYRLRHREILRSVLSCPILVPNALVGRYLQELIV